MFKPLIKPNTVFVFMLENKILTIPQTGCAASVAFVCRHREAGDFLAFHPKTLDVIQLNKAISYF